MEIRKYLLTRNKETIAAILRVCEKFPCFINAEAASATQFWLSVKLRVEDVAGADRILRPYI